MNSDINDVEYQNRLRNYSTEELLNVGSIIDRENFQNRYLMIFRRNSEQNIFK